MRDYVKGMEGSGHGVAFVPDMRGASLLVFIERVA